MNSILVFLLPPLNSLLEKSSKLKDCPFSSIAQHLLWYLSVICLNSWLSGPKLLGRNPDRRLSFAEEDILWKGLGTLFFDLTCKISLEIKSLKPLNDQSSKLAWLLIYFFQFLNNIEPEFPSSAYCEPVSLGVHKE